MREEITVKKSDGTTFTRKKKDMNFGEHIHIRIDAETLNQFKVIATNEDIKYNKLARQIIENYVEEYINGKLKGDDRRI